MIVVLWKPVVILCMLLCLASAVLGVEDSDIEGKAVFYYKLDNATIVGVTGNNSVDSAEGFNGTIYGADGSRQVDGKLGQAYSFPDDSAKYIDSGCDNDCDWGAGVSFAFCAWVNLDNAPSGANDVVMDKRYVGAGDKGYGIQFHNGGELRFETVAGGKSFTNNYGVAVWVHVCAVFNNTANMQYLYVNGSLADSDANAGDITASEYAVHIGTDPLNDAGGFDGKIDQAIMFSDALSLEEVQYIYNSGDGREFFASGGAGNTLPDAVLLADWIYPATSPDTDNEAVVWLNWTDSVDAEGQTINYTLYVNGSKEWSGLNVSEYQWTLPAEAHYLLMVSAGNGSAEVVGDNMTYKHDLSSPAIANSNDVANDNSSVTGADLLWFNATLSDANEVYAYNLSFRYKGNGSVIQYNWSVNLNATSYVLNVSLDSSGLNGSIIRSLEVSDSHTLRGIRDYGVREVRESSLLEFDTGDNLVSVQLLDVVSWDYRRSYSTRVSRRGSVNRFGTWKESDRYVFDVDTSISRNPYNNYEYTFLVRATEPLVYLKDSPFIAHFVSGKNWIDFSQVRASGAVVDRIDDFTVRVKVYSRSEEATFRSIGGLNSLTEELEFVVDHFAPEFSGVVSVPSSAVYSYDQSFSFGVEAFDVNGVVAAVFEWNGTNHSGSNIAGDFWGVSGFDPSASAQATNSWKVFVNDSLGNVGVSPVYNWTLSQANYTLIIDKNVTLWKINNGTSITINSSGDKGTVVFQAVNFTSQANPYEWNDVQGVGVFNITAWAGSVNWTNVTFSQALNVTASQIGQTPPVTSSVRVSSVTNTTVSDVRGFVTGTDTNLDTLAFEYKWFLNGALFSGLGIPVVENDTYGSWGFVEAGAGILTNEAFAVDGDWSTFAYASGANGQSGFIYENYTLPAFSDIINASWKFKIKTVAGATTGKLWNYFWNYSKGDWSYASNFAYGNDSGLVNYSIILDDDFLNGSVLRSQTELHRGSLGGASYYEGALVLVSKPYVQGVEVNLANFSSSDLTLGDSLIFSGRAFDGVNYSSWLNSSALVVVPVNLSVCDATNDYQVLNFTVRDVENSSVLVSDWTAVFDYWSSSGDAVKSYTASGSAAETFAFCVSPDLDGAVLSDFTVYYDAVGYPQKRYDVVNASLVSGGGVTDLYLLHEDEGIYARFYTVDEYELLLSGVSVVMREYVNGSLVVTETAVSDDSGYASFFVDPDVYYYFNFSKSGYSNAVLNIRPTTTDTYTITLNAVGVGAVNNFGVGVEYLFLPVDSVLNNGTNYTFGFNLSSDYWSLDACSVYLLGNASVVVQSGSDNVGVCSVSFLQNSGSYANFTVRGVVTFNGTNLSYQKTYSVIPTYTGQFSLKTFFDDLSAFRGFGFNDFSRMLIALVIIIGVTYGTSRAFGLGVSSEGDVEIMLVIIAVLVFFFSYLGWFVISGFSLPSGKGLANLPQYMIFYVVTLAVIGWIIGRDR